MSKKATGAVSDRDRATYVTMVLAEYAKRIVLFEAEGFRPPTIAKMLESEGIFVSRWGVAKFLLQVKATGSSTIIEATYILPRV